MNIIPHREMRRIVQYSPGSIPSLWTKLEEESRVRIPAIRKIVLKKIEKLSMRTRWWKARCCCPQEVMETYRAARQPRNATAQQIVLLGFERNRSRMMQRIAAPTRIN
jgi:myo-inositol catabolism protein IolC